MQNILLLNLANELVICFEVRFQNRENLVVKRIPHTKNLINLISIYLSGNKVGGRRDRHLRLREVKENQKIRFFHPVGKCSRKGTEIQSAEKTGDHVSYNTVTAR